MHNSRKLQFEQATLIECGVTGTILISSVWAPVPEGWPVDGAAVLGSNMEFS
jgi:hypothetical protein